MIFNKKRDEDLPQNFATDPRPAASPPPPSQLQSNQVQPSKARKGQARSVIDPGLIITGTLEGDGELQIDGEVRGNIRCTHLTVGDAATIEGSIAADEVVVRGTVKGIIGGNRVVLTDGAHVESDIFHKRLAIEEGARFEGAARYNEQPIEKARSKTAEMASDAPPTATTAESDGKGAAASKSMPAPGL
jgi:cytoskeletal protein CcmA (bactofilin family)